jgi:hypothetical protein
MNNNAQHGLWSNKKEEKEKRIEQTTYDNTLSTKFGIIEQQKEKTPVESNN